MNDVPFHLTRMGQRFYEHTMPRLVEELAKLNERLAELAKAVGKPGNPPCIREFVAEDRSR